MARIGWQWMTMLRWRSCNWGKLVCSQVNQRRKSSWISLASSMRRWRATIMLGTSCKFWKINHWPRTKAVSKRLQATPPLPAPSAKYLTLVLAMPCTSASFFKWNVGSGIVRLNNADNILNRKPNIYFIVFSKPDKKFVIEEMITNMHNLHYNDC